MKKFIYPVDTDQFKGIRERGLLMKRIIILALFALSTFNFQLSICHAQSFVINEIMAANIDVYQDPSTNFGSWVELYNPTGKAVTLGGLYVSNDPTNLKQHQLVSNYGTLPANGFAILNFDHHENFTTYSFRQIDDKLDVDGGTIIVSDGINILAQETYPAAIGRVSYARTTDGGTEWGLTSSPTPGQTNSTSPFATTQLAAPEVTPEAQFFTTPLQIKVNIPEGATLRYTIDGTTPTLTNGSTSTDGILSTSSTQCYRFRLFQDGKLASHVVTRSYINDSLTHPFPVISIVTNKSFIMDGSTKAIFGYSSYGRPGNGQLSAYNANMDWDRPVSFEYFDALGKCVLAKECDFSACGGWSRGRIPHSFKLKANKIYDGQNYIPYQFFGTVANNPTTTNGKQFLKHKTLQIRNGGSDINCRIKDAAIQEIVTSSGLYVEHQSWQPVMVYLNGVYQYVLNMREPNNKHYGYANYGIDTDKMDQFEMSLDSGFVQKEGTKEMFNRWHQLSTTASTKSSYDEICRIVDINEYINYMAVCFYSGTNDWPQNNIKAFRSQEDGRFRFVLFDLDSSLSTNNPLSDFFGRRTYTFNTLYGYDYSKDKSLTHTRITKEIELVTIFQNMLANETFRKNFIDTYCLVAGSIFQPQRVSSIVDKMSSYLSTGGYVNPANTSDFIKNGFTTNRQNTLINELKSNSNMKLSSVTPQQVTLSSNVDGAQILVNDIEVPTGSFAGKLFAPITVTAKAPAGYKFLGWLSSSQTGDKPDFELLRTTAGAATYVSTSPQYQLPSSGTQTLVASWEKISPAIVQTTSVARPIKINEVSAANETFLNELFKKDDWIELYNTTDTDLDVAGLYLTDNPDKPQKYQIASSVASTIIPAKGHLVIWCSKREAESMLHTSFKLDNADGSTIILSSSDEFFQNNAAFFAAHPEQKVAFADTLNYNTMLYDQTAGRYPDGGEEYYLFNHSTIAYANSLQSSDQYIGADAPTKPDTDAIINISTDDDTNASHRYYTPSGIFVGTDRSRLPRGIYKKGM